MKTAALSLTCGAKRLVRVLAFFATLAGLLVTPQTVGAQGNVNLYTGDATYTVPIVTPPGTNGMGPSLSLNYSSGGRGDDSLSEGWSLSGLGSIDRLGVNYSPSPMYSEYSPFPASDNTFRLNFPGGGGKLVYAGTDPAGNVGNYYRTQIESFLRIEYVSASNYWLVTDKGGTKYFFGQTAATQQDNPGKAAQVFSWKLDKVMDTHGVFFTVSYDKDVVDGDMYPKQIVYSQGAGLACTPVNLAACRTVDFILTPRVSADPNYLSFLFNDFPVSYNTGSRIIGDKLINSIEMKLGGAVG